MKTYIDKLRETPAGKLQLMIRGQESEIAIMQRDLATMKEVLAEKTAKPGDKR